jgi:arylsulfatase A-like enzyme
MISIDTLRADHLGMYGYERPTSPELDAFAAGATVFEAVEAAAPWTLPSLTSVLTGEYTSTHRCWVRGSVLDGSFTTLAERLLAAGYDTACHAAQQFVTTRQGLHQGFVHFDESYAYTELKPERSITSPALSDKGVRFLEQKAAAPLGAPWFLWLHYLDPHGIYLEHAGISEHFVTPGQRTPQQIERDLYDGEIRFTDLHVGRVLDALERTGLAANTIVVFFSDHGEEFGDHGGRGHGHTLFQELVRVPLVVRVPGAPPARVRQIVRHVDLLPTLLELCGLPVPAGLPGRSLAELVRGGTLPEVTALSELALSESNTVESVRRGALKFMRTRQRGGRLALFDLARDPGEKDDLQSERPELARELEQELDSLQALARERATLYQHARRIAFTPAEEADLNALGYGGEHSPDGSAPER